jgi:carbon-monoxide dehydrogenase medium subunit
MRPYDYVEPSSVAEVVALMAQYGDDAHLIAGGTSVVLMMRQGLLRPAVLVGLRGIADLRGTHSTVDGSLVIGATHTLRSLENAPEVAEYEPALARALGAVASVRIRNQASIGGSIAHADPAQDPPPILIALEATVRVTGPTGDRQIPLDALFVDFFETNLEPGEVITAVVLPPRGPGSHAVYLKFLPGSQDDYATISVAVSGRRFNDAWHDLRVVCGAAGPTPLRIRSAEAVLEGTQLDEAEVATAARLVADAVDPIDDLRGSADYKCDMANVWTRRALQGLAERATRSRST